TEARVILEIGFMGQCIANSLVEKLDIDRSYMSRIIAKLGKEGLIRKENSESDSRTSLISLTDQGLEVFSQLDEKSDEQIHRLFKNLSEKDIQEIHASRVLIQQKLEISEGAGNDTF
ncbi:MarR family transcriptional regulator, partial [Escherichia coli]|nr:MarR family transcriptional regulator [Escherichia coli]